MKYIARTFAFLLLFTMSFAHAADLPTADTKAKWRTWTSEEVGYSIDAPRFWQQWMEETDEDGHTNLIVGLTGRKISGMVVMVTPMGGSGGGLNLDDLGYLQMMTGESPELEVLDAEPVEVAGAIMMHMSAQLSNPETNKHLELEVYLGSHEMNQVTIVYIASPAHYGKVKKDFDRSIASLQWLDS